MPSMANENDINIAVAMYKDCLLDNNSKSILKNKLQQMLSTEGVSGTEYSSIIMVPEVNVSNSKTISGGMRNISSVELSITITVKHLITNTVFNTYNVSTNGEGYSQKEAERNAINRVNHNAPQCVDFIRNTKSRIYTYYKSNTNTIISKANSLATQQKYDEALAILSTYPESLPDYGKIEKVMSQIFKQSQTQYCKQLLLAAQTAFSQQDYDTSAEYIAMIDAQSDCAGQAKALLQEIAKKKDKQYNDMIALQREQMQSEERITKIKINAIKDIATAYYKRQQNYVFLW